MMPLGLGFISRSAATKPFAPTKREKPCSAPTPIAVAIPADRDRPSGDGHGARGFGKVRLKAALWASRQCAGWMIDRAGHPLTDTGEGFLLRIGDYKGYALSLMIGLLAGTSSSGIRPRSWTSSSIRTRPQIPDDDSWP